MMDIIEKFITDFGESVFEESGGILYRYAVWENIEGRPQVVECSNTLADLKPKYSVPDNLIFAFTKKDAKNGT